MDCVEVMALRNFRDEKLIGTKWGDAIVSTYYRISPSIASWVSQRPIAKKMLKNFIIGPFSQFIIKSKKNDK